MLNKVVIFFVLLIAGMIAFHRALASGDVLRVLDRYPNSPYVPRFEYYLGEVYYFFQNVGPAEVYFQRITERFPNSPYADDAAYAYIQCLEDSPGVNRATLIAEYQKYMERFPSGKSVAEAQSRMDAYRTGGQ